FELRMLGAAASIADPNVVLNTSVAEALREFADQLEASGDFHRDLAALIQKTFHEHKRIVYNGNNYAKAWIDEAEIRRGLSHRKTTVDALPVLVSPESVELFARHHVFTQPELRARYEVLLENYCKTIHIEALTMADMVKGDIIPACVAYQNDLAQLLARKASLVGHDYDYDYNYDNSLESHLLHDISGLAARLLNALTCLLEALEAPMEGLEPLDKARFHRDTVSRAMSGLRSVADELEAQMAKKYWPYPTYGQMLYSVV
ncbi:MAG: glutamine synthetase, partial [Oscillospiraceae bacterium]|nr:glutamine synthetase [Oscillospiraceae bacterium]